MDIRIIVFGMCAVLFALFIGAHFYEPKAKIKAKAEANYFESLKSYQSNPDNDHLQNCLQMASEFITIKKLTISAQDLVNKDISKMGLAK